MKELDKTRFEKIGGEANKTAIFVFVVILLYITFTSKFSFIKCKDYGTIIGVVLEIVYLIIVTLKVHI